MKKLIATLFGVVLAAGLTLAATTTVQQGDSLGSIAARYGTTVEVLQQLNGLKNVNIRVGQVLRLPQTSRLTVRSGDSLESIAARNGVSVAALRAANGLSSDRIRVGQELKLPNSSQSSVTTTRSSSVSSNSTITVQNGDTLGEIAQRAGISAEQLRQLNNLNGDSIRVGQVLKISASQPSSQNPKPKASAGTVTVKAGDTLGEIASRNNVSLKDLQKINGLSGINIRIGQVLRLPSAANQSQISATKPKPSSQVVVVQAGDTLGAIAARNKVKVEDLRAVNNLKTDAIGIGDRLRLPASSQNQAKPKPTASSAKPKPTASSAKPKPAVSSAKPKPTATTPKPSTASAKPKPNAATVNQKPTTSSVKPSATTSSVKPAVSTSAKPSMANKPNPNTRVIAPPPNLPNATVKIISVKPQANAPKPNVVAIAPKPKPSVAVAPKPSITVLPPITDTTPKPNAPATKPSATVAVAPRPSGMPSNLGFNEPLEAPEDASPIDPALESPFFDATAPEGKPTAPSDLISEDIEIEIPENLSAGSVSPSTSPNAPTFSRAEKVLWPLSGIMTSRFGWRRLGRTRFHTGVDLAAPTGTRVYAALSGKVEFAGWNRQGYGNLVIIRGWDNRQYYYGHNSRLLVKRGQWVRQGQVISRVGSTGFSTGPHLHFEIRINNRARNPLAYLPRSRLAQASAVGR